MCQAEIKSPTLHPFEAAGLGLAPFKFVGCYKNVFVACPGAPAKAGGTCDFCYQGIMYCNTVQSSDGKQFVVGCDCIRRLGSADNRLLSQAERAMANLKKEQKDAERKAKQEKREAERAAAEQAERDANGGFTLYELAKMAEREERQAQQRQLAELNHWLVGFLRNHNQSPFIVSMIEKLETEPAGSLSPRCRDILCDIWAKAVGGRKAYHEHYAEFQKQFRETVAAGEALVLVMKFKRV